MKSKYRTLLLTAQGQLSALLQDSEPFDVDEMLAHKQTLNMLVSTVMSAYDELSSQTKV
jgi:cytochrome c556